MQKYFDGKQFSNPGDPIHIIYGPKVNDDGTVDLIEVGKENTDDIIESHRESTDMNIILAKIAAGDDSVLNQRKGMFGDFTEMPKTYAEALQMQIDAERMYDSLPVDVKSKFDNDKNKFFALAGTEEWLDKCGFEKINAEEKGEVSE